MPTGTYTHFAFFGAPKITPDLPRTARLPPRANAAAVLQPMASVVSAHQFLEIRSHSREAFETMCRRWFHRQMT
jgi:hypothetical protein